MNRSERARRAFLEDDHFLSLAAHQSNELAEIAAGRNDGLHDQKRWEWVSVEIVCFGNSVICAMMCGRNFDPNILIYFIFGFLLSILCILAEYLEFSRYSAWAQFERARECWEVENFPEGEIEEMFHIYQSHGISVKDARILTETLSKYPSFWVDHMLVLECGLHASDENKLAVKVVLQKMVKQGIIGGILSLVIFGIGLYMGNVIACITSNLFSLVFLFIQSPLLSKSFIFVMIGILQIFGFVIGYFF